MAQKNNNILIPQGYKSSPLGSIPNDWEVKELKDCCIIKGQYGINAPAVEFSDELPTYIRITDIDDNGNYSTIKKASVGDPEYQKYILQSGDILFARTGATVGKTYLYNEKDGILVFAGFLIRFTTNNKVLLPKFLKNYTDTKSYWNWVGMVSMRSGQPGINAEEYGLIKLPIPSIIEQSNIANLLSMWDEAISKVLKLIEQHEKRKIAILQTLISKKKDWNKLTISKIAKEVSIRNKNNQDLIVLSCTKYDGLVPSLEYFGRKIYSDDLSTYKIVPKNHFAYATNHIEEGSIGYQSSLDASLISPMYTVFKSEESIINDQFLYRVLKSHTYIHEYKKRMEGSIDRRGGLRWEEFSKIKIPVPNLEEQNSVVLILDLTDQEIKLLRLKLEKFKEQKKGLMQQLLTGKKRLKF